MQTLSSVPPLNVVQNLPVTTSEKEEEFEFSPSNVAADVNISNYLDILEIISDFRSDLFTLNYIELPGISYMIECTNT